MPPAAVWMSGLPAASTSGKHAFSERIYELGGILAESLTRPTASVSYGRIVDFGNRNVVRRRGGTSSMSAG